MYNKKWFNKIFPNTWDGVSPKQNRLVQQRGEVEESLRWSPNFRKLGMTYVYQGLREGKDGVMLFFLEHHKSEEPREEERRRKQQARKRYQNKSNAMQQIL